MPEFVKNILDAHLSSQEETIFGRFLEDLAIFVCSQVYGGRKSAAEGIDLEFETDSTKYIVSIKSGPNWGNSSQVKKLRDNFKRAKRILGTKVTCFGKKLSNLTQQMPHLEHKILQHQRARFLAANNRVIDASVDWTDAASSVTGWVEGAVFTGASTGVSDFPSNLPRNSAIRRFAML